MRRKRVVLLAGSLAVAGIAAGLVASAGSAGTSAQASAQGQSFKLYLIPKFVGIPVFTLNGKGAKEAGAKLGDSVTYKGPTEASAAKQVPFINSAASQGYDAIIISANDPNAVAPALKRAQQRGVKVVSYDADTAPDARTIYVSPPDPQSIGFNQVDNIASQIGGKGDIAILSAAPTAANQNEWIKWMKVRLKKFPGIKLVKTAYGNDNDTKSATETTALLQAYPNLKANTNFLALQAELGQTENKIAYARQFFNNAVQTLNTTIQSVPSNVIAGLGGFRTAEYFEASGDERR